MSDPTLSTCKFTTEDFEKAEKIVWDAVVNSWTRGRTNWLGYPAFYDNVLDQAAKIEVLKTINIYKPWISRKAPRLVNCNNIKYKPRPEPPRYYFLDNDECWNCNRNWDECNSCKRLKHFRREYRDQKDSEKERLEYKDYLNESRE